MKKLILFICIIASCILCGCKNSKGKAEPLSKSGFAFDTFITISIYDEKDSRILDECFNMCENYENLFSKTIDTSEISKINKSKGENVKVSKDTFELIEKGLYYGEISDGLFDITIAPVSNLWDFHGEGTVPDDSLIQNTINHVSYKNLSLNKADFSVSKLDPDLEIDLGGIAKGYIADRLKEYLLSQNVKSALINLGGNIIAIGTKPDGTPFKIGIKKPFNENEIDATVELNNRAVSTSGVYERCFYEGDKLYHHILNPQTGYPVETDLWGVSIVCDSSTDADAIGTICILMGYDKAKTFCESFENIDVIWSLAEK